MEMDGFGRGISRKALLYEALRRLLCDGILNVVLSIYRSLLSPPPQSWDIFCSEEQRNRAFPLYESRDNRRERNVFAFSNVAIVSHASFEQQFSRRLFVYFIRRAVQTNVRLPFSWV